MQNSLTENTEEFMQEESVPKEVITTSGETTVVSKEALVAKEVSRTSFKKVMMTVFWVGEGGGENNDFISNSQNIHVTILL